jgi:hypothetical protein
LPETQNACGEEVRHVANSQRICEMQTSVNQEPNITPNSNV